MSPIETSVYAIQHNTRQRAAACRRIKESTHASHTHPANANVRARTASSTSRCNLALTPPLAIVSPTCRFASAAITASFDAALGAGAHINTHTLATCATTPAAVRASSRDDAAARHDFALILLETHLHPRRPRATTPARAPDDDDAVVATIGIALVGTVIVVVVVAIALVRPDTKASQCDAS